MDLVLFDLDGTLADTLEDVARAANHALASLGFPVHEPSAYRAMIGEGVVELARRALPPGREDRRDEAVDRLRAYYAAHLVESTAPYDGIPALLAELDRRGVPTAVLSNKPDPATREIVGRLFPGHRFASVAGQRAGVPRKPDPAAALEIAASLGAAPASTLFVGDSWIDMETAKAAGMVPVGVRWGFRDREELERHGARAILERPADLLTLLG